MWEETHREGDGGWDGEFYKLTRMLLFGQVKPADSLTFHQVVFLSLTVAL